MNPDGFLSPQRHPKNAAKPPQISKAVRSGAPGATEPAKETQSAPEVRPETENGYEMRDLNKKMK